jgi:hypothetical protein
MKDGDKPGESDQPKQSLLAKIAAISVEMMHFHSEKTCGKGQSNLSNKI